MWRVRTTKTGSGNTAIQVVRREHQRTIIVKHIGTAKTADEVNKLCRQAENYIRNKAGLMPLFPALFGQENQLTQTVVEQVINRLDGQNAYHTFAHTFLSYFYNHLGFAALKNDLLRDLSLIRIIEPCSKRRSLLLLEKYFALHYGRTTMQQSLAEILKQKESIETIAVSFAKKEYAFDFSVVFYDVTTLYYESFTEDEDITDATGNLIEKGLRKKGFGKEPKIGQPIIVIGLIVTGDGFPVSYEVFEGNTFEGHTFIPIIKSFKQKYAIEDLTIVADAAMISFDNIEKLKEHVLSYIVGARIANLKQSEMRQISSALIGEAAGELEVAKKDGATTQIETEKGLLLCEFSIKRYKKDKWEMEKQIAKAEKLVKGNNEGKRTKFLMLKKGEKEKKKGKKQKEQLYMMNNTLIEQTKMLLGIKGYYTNLFEKATRDKPVTEQDIIDQYHNLWRVEKAFRIAKSDLQARPIFHQKRENIQAHILIVFVSLCMSKSIELLTKLSIQKVKDLIWDVLEIQLIDIPSGKIFLKQINASENPMVELLQKLQNVDIDKNNKKSRTI